MSDPSPPNATPSPTGLGGWLSNINNLLTMVGACVAAVAAIYSSINKGKIEQVETQVKNLELHSAMQKASNEFADLFLDKALKDDKLMGHEKHVQALLSVLNIVAHPNDKSGDKARVMTPLTLALLMGEPGGVAGMDANYELFDDWVAIAYADNSPKTRVTAIQALAGIYYKALSQQRLDMMHKAVEAINRLYAMLPETPDFRDPANTTRIQLGSFIQVTDSLVTAAFVPKDKIPQGKSINEPALRDSIRTAFSDAAQIGLDRAEKLTASVKQLVESDRPEAGEKVAMEKQTLAQLNAVLAMATQATQEKAQTDAKSGTPTSAGGTSSSDAFDNLIKDLRDSDDVKRRRARSQLALLGQTAVKPLLKEVAARFGKNKEEDYKTRLGIATAFKLMKQQYPITLDDADAYWMVSLVRSNDSETRYNTAEFLRNLESGSSVRNCFNALEHIFYELSLSAKDKDAESAVRNIASVIGTWARVITPDNPSREPNKPFPQFALERAKEWQKLLASGPMALDWKKTTDTLDELIKKADSNAMRAAR